MGKRGPAPKPTALKKSEGSYRADKDSSLEVDGFDEQVPAPEGLSEYAKGVWQSIMSEYVPYGIISANDLPLLHALCQAFDRYRKCQEMLDKHGYEVVDDMGNVNPSKWIDQADKCMEKVLKLCSHFGLSPSSRASIRMDPKKNSSKLKLD